MQRMVTSGDVIRVQPVRLLSQSAPPAGDGAREPEAKQEQGPWWLGPMPERITVQAGEPWTYTPVPGYAYEFGTGRLVPLPGWAKG